jgi:HNH endonuclease
MPTRILIPIDHPAVVGLPYPGRNSQGALAIMIRLQCPRCQKIREWTASSVRTQIKRVLHFRGFCRPCSTAARKDGTHRNRPWGRPRISRKKNNGYLLVAPRDVSDELLPMFKQMQDRSYTVLEHRWIMALHLRRPLARNECVDHLNGDKTDNRIENLRLYVHRRNQPGSTYGYGTFYDEWQRALAEIERLKAELSRFNYRDCPLVQSLLSSR